ncbi:MAG: tRNA pseudouridine(55) synthase TruB [Ignavibacteriae bacterium]|nr:tRNA pseudouridine(55) synthase TruB [Ignavibacteriota bacterium]
MFFLTRKSSDKAEEWLSEAETTGLSVLIDKEKEWTSFDVIAKLRRITGIRKIGHTGTLDPLATGLLIVCIGKATKSIENFKNDFKTYEATIKIGVTTKSFDKESEEIEWKSENTENVSLVSHISIENLNEELIRDVINSFMGISEQEPPLFSAKKINGVPAYKLARKNKDFRLKSNRIEISEIQIKRIEIPFITFKIVCSAGTYIRALARDIGIKLNCGAYLYELRRTDIGDFSVENAFTINEINELINIIRAKKEIITEK